ncbi:MAG TPA: hypothetical protein VMV69_02360 [Pirellulales bacterium]|nr:hypothetical protein [Pirellulales bacterium]
MLLFAMNRRGGMSRLLAVPLLILLVLPGCDRQATPSGAVAQQAPAKPVGRNDQATLVNSAATPLASSGADRSRDTISPSVGATRQIAPPTQRNEKVERRDSRSKWLNESYDATFLRVGEKEWHNINNKTGLLHCKEVETERSKEYVELFCPDRNYHLRFYPDKAEFKRPGSQWAWVANGHWVEAIQDDEERIARPAPAAPDKSTAAKTEKLADLEKRIAAKKKQLADLDKRAAAEQTKRAAPLNPGAAAEAPKGKVYRSTEELLADMPTDAYPKFGPVGAVERSAARKWVKANVVGRTVEWKMTVERVEIAGDDPFRVILIATQKRTVSARGAKYSPYGAGFSFGKAFRLGGQLCQGLLDFKGAVINHKWSFSCTAAQAVLLRKLKGEEVTLRTTVLECNVGDGQIEIRENGRYVRYDWVPILVGVSSPSVGQFLRAASKANTAEKDTSSGTNVPKSQPTR